MVLLACRTILARTNLLAEHDRNATHFKCSKATVPQDNQSGHFAHFPDKVELTKYDKHENTRYAKL